MDVLRRAVPLPVVFRDAKRAFVSNPFGGIVALVKVCSLVCIL